MLSAGWPFERAAAEQVHVNMVYRLARITAVVDDHAIPRVSHTQFARKLAGDYKQLAHHLSITFAQLIYRCDVFARDDQNVDGCARIWL